MTGISMARSTRSGTGLGPGIWRKCRPWCLVMIFSVSESQKCCGLYCIQFFRVQSIPCLELKNLENPKIIAFPALSNYRAELQVLVSGGGVPDVEFRLPAA